MLIEWKENTALFRVDFDLSLICNHSVYFSFGIYPRLMFGRRSQMFNIHYGIFNLGPFRFRWDFLQYRASKPFPE